MKYNNNNVAANGKSYTHKKYSMGSKLFGEPCVLCEALNKPERYHPLYSCRNKQHYTEMKKVNVAEANQIEIDELLKFELDNKRTRDSGRIYTTYHFGCIN